MTSFINNDETVVIYSGRDNTIDLVLTQQNKDVALNNVSRMVLTVGNQTLDSDVAAAAFDWTQEDAAGNDKLVLKLGAFLSAGINGRARLVVYDAINTNGIVWISDDTKDKPNLSVCVL